MEILFQLLKKLKIKRNYWVLLVLLLKLKLRIWVTYGWLYNGDMNDLVQVIGMGGNNGANAPVSIAVVREVFAELESSFIM